MLSLKITNLQYVWPEAKVPTIDIPELQVERKDAVFLQGASGSGKSTLLGLLAGTLKATGGTLHIHMNVEEERIESWCQETMQKCVQYAKDAGRNWEVVSHHLEKVKWYAPRIRHVVLDVSFSSMSSAFSPSRIVVAP